MTLTVEPPPVDAPDAGVIEEARQRQHHHRVRAAALVSLAAIAGVSYLAGGRSGGHVPRTTANASSWSAGSVGAGITIRYPHGWHLYAPPITSLAYPLDRMLLTSYPTRTGGDCSPTGAESALPSNGVLIYLFEYTTAPGVLGRPPGTVFAPQPGAFTLPARSRANYECWTVPSYLVRFQAAGRLFQLQAALGPDVSRQRRAEVLDVLDSLRVSSAATRVNSR